MSGKTANLNLRNEPELKAEVAAYAKRFGLSISQIIRWALLKYLQENPNGPVAVEELPRRSKNKPRGPGPSPDQAAAVLKANREKLRRSQEKQKS